MIDFEQFRGPRAFNDAPEALQKPRGARWRAMVTVHDSQSSLASV